MNPHTYKFWGGAAAPQNITYSYGGYHFYTDYSGNTLFVQTKNAFNQDTYESTSDVKLFSSDDLNTFYEVATSNTGVIGSFLLNAEGISAKSAGIQAYTYGADAANMFTVAKTFNGVTLNGNAYLQLSMPRTTDAMSDLNWSGPGQTYMLTQEIANCITYYENLDPTNSTVLTLMNLVSDDQFTITGINMNTNNQMYVSFEGVGTKSASYVAAGKFYGATVDRVHPISGIQQGQFSYLSEIPYTGQVWPCYSSSRATAQYRAAEYIHVPQTQLHSPLSQLEWTNYNYRAGYGLWATPRYVHTLDDDGTYGYGQQWAIAPSGQMKEMSLQSGAGYLGGGYYMWDINEVSDTPAPPRFMGGTGKNACIIHVDGLVKYTTDRGTNWTTVSDDFSNRSLYDTLFEVLEEIKATQGTNWTFSWQGNCRTTPSGKILFTPSPNHLVYSEDGGQNWAWLYLNSAIYGMAHAHEKADGSIYVSSSGNWTFHKVHDGTNWLGSPTVGIQPISQGYGSNVWNTGIFWYDEVATTWYFLGNNGQGYAISGAEPVFTSAPTYNFVTNHGFPSVTANFDTNSSGRVIHYMGDNTYAWTNIHNNTVQWLDITNMTSVLYDVTGSDLQNDAIGDKWSALIPTGTYADPGLIGEFFIEKRYNSSTSSWVDNTAARDQFAGGYGSFTFVEPTFTFDYTHYNHAPILIPQANITNNGSGYSSSPTITLSAPDQPGGVQATVGSYNVSNGAIYNIYLDERGSGYFNPITVTVTDSTGTGFACTPITPRNTVATVIVDDPNRVLRPVQGYGTTVELMHSSDFPGTNSLNRTTFAAAELNPLVFAGYNSYGATFAAIDNKLATIYALSTNSGAYTQPNTGINNYIFNTAKAHNHYMSKYELSTIGFSHITKHNIWDKFTNLPNSYPRLPVITSSTYNSSDPATTFVEDTQGTGYIIVDTLTTVNASNTYDSGKTYLVGYVEINGDGANTVTFDYFLHLATYDSVADQFTLRDQLQTYQHTLDTSAGFTQQEVPRWYAYVNSADGNNTYMYYISKSVNWASEFINYFYTTDAGASFTQATDLATDFAGGAPQWNSTLNVWVSWNNTTAEISTSPNINGPWTVVATDLAGFLP